MGSSLKRQRLGLDRKEMYSKLRVYLATAPPLTPKLSQHNHQWQYAEAKPSIQGEAPSDVQCINYWIECCDTGSSQGAPDQVVRSLR